MNNQRTLTRVYRRVPSLTYASRLGSLREPCSSPTRVPLALAFANLSKLKFLVAAGDRSSRSGRARLAMDGCAILYTASSMSSASRRAFTRAPSSSTSAAGGAPRPSAPAPELTGRRGARAGRARALAGALEGSPTPCDTFATDHTVAEAIREIAPVGAVRAQLNEQ